ncbi:uncharacterized protein LOC121188011 [Toxotes jaculatrix]|uniref:uncharacterized protein LOC121188011 n=1 Tax=Toxotes jaculatrix TaxID=941984 RepID=UPI001B3AD919|nr:uncharacterized protein LOC121188011 [Toxotes jaculatrix]
MLLLLVSVSSVFVGSSADVSYENLCYGRSLNFPFDYAPPVFHGMLFFTPSNGGPRKLMMNNAEAKDPRLKVNYGSVRLTDLTERDEGTFSISLDGDRLYSIVKLTIADCATQINRHYGDMYESNIPRKAQFLEFTPLGNLDTSEVLWNRSYPQTNKGGRVQVKRNMWEIYNLNQADNGYYNFRGSDNTLLSRIQLLIQEHYRHFDAKVKKLLYIKYPVDYAWTWLAFTPEGKTVNEILMDGQDVESGRLLRPGRFNGRIELLQNGLEINPVESTDSGTFSFRDQHGNLVFTVKVEVMSEFIPASVYVPIIAVIIIVVIVCCCYVRYRLRDTNPSASYSAAPPTSAFSNQSTEPTATSLGPTVYSPVNIHMSSPKPEAAVQGDQGEPSAPSVGSDWLSSGPEPKFDVKGLTFPSAGPLSSESTFSDVYTSDKLNFL